MSNRMLSTSANPIDMCRRYPTIIAGSIVTKPTVTMLCPWRRRWTNAQRIRNGAVAIVSIHLYEVHAKRRTPARAVPHESLEILRHRDKSSVDRLNASNAIHAASQISANVMTVCADGELLTIPFKPGLMIPTNKSMRSNNSVRGRNFGRSRKMSSANARTPNKMLARYTARFGVRSAVMQTPVTTEQVSRHIRLNARSIQAWARRHWEGRRAWVSPYATILGNCAP
jgi:hypothetical protein